MAEGEAEERQSILVPTTWSLRYNKPTKTMVSIPVEVLLMILEHLSRRDLAKMCLVNKICCSYSQDVLYRDVSGETLLCRMLAQSTHLARRVRSFERRFTTEYLDDCRFITDALRNMSSLR